MNDGIKLSGHISIKHIRDGKVIDTREVKNLIVDGGKALIATGLSANTDIHFTHIGIGTGTTAAVTGEDKLVDEVLTRGTVTATPTLNVVSFVSTAIVNSVSIKSITEAGLFNKSSGRTMFSRQVFDPIVLQFSPADSLVITWTITVN